MACFRRAVSVRPGFTLAASNLATALTDAGELDEALAWFNLIRDEAPDPPGEAPE